MHINGILLLHWIFDKSTVPGRLLLLSKKLAPHAPYLATQKLAPAVLLKLICQNEDEKARRWLIVKGICANEETITSALFKDDYHGVVDTTMMTMMSNRKLSESGTRIVMCSLKACAPEERQRIATIIRRVLRRVANRKTHLDLLDKIMKN